MLGAVIAIALGLGLWELNVFFKKRRLQGKFEGGKRFDINKSLYGYLFNTYFVIVFRKTHEEMFRIERSKVQRIALGSVEDRSNRKSAEVVVLEWLQENGTPRAFFLDINEPGSRAKAESLIGLLS